MMFSLRSVPCLLTAIVLTLIAVNPRAVEAQGRPSGIRVTVTGANGATGEVSFDVTLNTAGVYGSPALTMPTGLLGDYIFTTFYAATYPPGLTATLLSPAVNALDHGNTADLTGNLVPRDKIPQTAPGTFRGSFTYTYPDAGPRTIQAQTAAMLSRATTMPSITTGSPIVNPNQTPNAAGTQSVFGSWVGRSFFGGTMTYNLVGPLGSPPFVWGVENSATVTFGSVGDTVWCDGVTGTGNGVFDAGEGLAGVEVLLYDDIGCDGIPNGAAIATQDTMGDGQYLFEGLSLGPAASPICFVAEVDTSDPDLGACTTPDTPVQQSPAINVDSPADLDVDFSFVEPLGSIGDTVWCDGAFGSGNGTFDPGEGLAGIGISLFADTDCNDTADGAAIATQDTTGDGQYLFSDLTVGAPALPACYVVRVDDTDIDLGACVLPLATTEQAPDLTSTVPDVLSADFGFEEPLGSIGDTVWCDGALGSGNGTFDPGEGLAGIGISLFADTDCNDTADGAAIATQDTVGDGQYLFSDLTVGAPALPACYVVRVDDTDTDLGACVLPLATTEQAPDLTSTVPDVLSADFGFEEPLGSIGDTVWCDGLENTGNGTFDAGEGVAGVGLELFEDTDCDDVADGPSIATTETVGDGQYTFADLRVGAVGDPLCYAVTVDAADADLVDCTQPLGPTTRTPDLEVGATDSLDSDFSFEITCVDADADGLCNESCVNDRDGDGDPDCSDYDPSGYLYCESTGRILQGGSVEVAGPGAIDLQEDGSSGRYTFFTDGTPGTYTISVTPPSGFPMSVACSDLGTFDPTGLPDPFALGSGEALSSRALVSSACANNPFYMTFELEPGDPFIINNNIPFASCSPLEVPTQSPIGLATLAALIVAAGIALLYRRRLRTAG